MTHINQRRDYASAWTSENPVLDLGEVGWERDTRRAKLGDGVTAWNDLPYAVKPVMGVADVPGLPQELANLAAGIEDVETNLDTKAPLNSPAFTGNPTAPTPPFTDMDTSVATTQFVHNAMPITYNGVARDDIDMDGYRITGAPFSPVSADELTSKSYVDNTVGSRAPLASPTFTGDPKAPTPATSDNDTTIATTAFVKAAIAAAAPPAVTPLTLVGSWANFGGTFTTAGYYKYGGRVYLQGLIRWLGSVSQPTTIATLPAGFRPPNTEILCALTENASPTKLIGDFRITSAGVMEMQSQVTNNMWVSLSGLSFRHA